MTPILLALVLSCNLDAPPAYDVRAHYEWDAADVDHDGEVDIVATSGLDVTVAYGTAGDAFEPPRVVAQFNRPGSIRAADLDGDGLRDLLLMRIEEQRGAVLLRNRGGRTFGDPELVLSGVPNLPLPVDLDGDGDLDLATSDDGVIVTALNDGRGRFTAGARSGATTFGTTLQPGDFDGDGKLDLLVLSSSFSARIFRGDGTGAFTLFQTIELARDTYTITAGDLNGDRYTDAVSPDRSTNSIHVRLGTPAGLDPPTSFAVPAIPWGARLADIDGDGDNDVLVFSSQGTTAGASFLNDGSGNLTKVADIPGSIAGLGVALADTNRDGITDLIAGAVGLRGTIAVVRGIGGGRFRAPERLAVARGERLMRVADVDGDGAADFLAIGNNPTIVTITYSGGGSEQVVIPETTYGLYAVEATSAPGLELAVAERDLVTLLERRSGQWSTVLTIPGTGLPRDVVAADARHLAITWLQDRGAAIESWFVALPDVPRWRAEIAPSTWIPVLARDFTGDGVSDLLVTGSGTPPNIPHDFTPLRDGYLSLFAGRGDGTYAEERRILSNESFVDAAAGDFDGDRDLDIVIGMRRGGDVVVLRNDGRGAFGAPEVIEEETERYGIHYGTGDLNADGIDDLVTSSGGITLTLRFGTPEGFVARPQVLGRGYLPRIMPVRPGGPPVVIALDTLTVIGLTCDDGRRRAAAR